MVLAKCGPCLHIPGLGWGGGVGGGKVWMCVQYLGVVQVFEEV